MFLEHSTSRRRLYIGSTETRPQYGNHSGALCTEALVPFFEKAIELDVVKPPAGFYATRMP